MQHLQGRTAVITGGARGIGAALARACGKVGMRVVVVDLPDATLDDSARSLRLQGIDALAHGVDVRDANAMQQMASAVLAHCGGVHLLCNNAGIAGVHRRFWRYSDAEWRRMLDVNLIGVINGLQAFLPSMLEHDDGHIVNTSSMAGLMPSPMNGPYVASKYAVVGLSEALQLDLRQHGSRLGVSVLCPGLVRTQLVDGLSADALAGLADEERAYNEAISAAMPSALDADEAARIVLDAVRHRRFYVLTDPAGLEPAMQRIRGLETGLLPDSLG